MKGALIIKLIRRITTVAVGLSLMNITEKSDSENTYECIKSFVIISTNDMVNWRFEGIIDTAAIAPWIMASWAPSVTSRVEEDGLTHFYLYFALHDHPNPARFRQL